MLVCIQTFMNWFGSTWSDDRYYWTLYFDDESNWSWPLFKVTGVWESKTFCSNYLTKFSVDLDGILLRLVGVMHSFYLVYSIFKGKNGSNNNIIIVIAFKGAIRDFFAISVLRRELSPTSQWPGRNRVQTTCNTLSAYHVQHVMLFATWYEGTAQLLSLTEFKLYLF